jgi:hypothetical protein
MRTEEIDLEKEIENLSDSDLNVWIRFFGAFADKYKAAGETSDARFLFALFNYLWNEQIRRKKLYTLITGNLGDIDFGDAV